MGFYGPSYKNVFVTGEHDSFADLLHREIYHETVLYASETISVFRNKYFKSDFPVTYIVCFL